MVFVLVVTAIFVAVSIYFFFRSEKLEAELKAKRREYSQTLKSSKAMADTVAVVASKHEEFLKFRLSKLQEITEENNDLKYVTPLINNYGLIFRNCFSANKQLKPTAEKCFESINPGSYKGFVTYLGTKDAHIRKMWAEGGLNGFMSLVEALLVEVNKSAIKKVSELA